MELSVSSQLERNKSSTQQQCARRASVAVGDSRSTDVLGIIDKKRLTYSIKVLSMPSPLLILR